MSWRGDLRPSRRWYSTGAMGRLRRQLPVRRLFAAGAVGAVVVTAALLVAGHTGGAVVTGVLHLLPAVLLALVLLSGRYPGELALERLRRAGTERVRRASSSPTPRLHAAVALRGGRLIAFSLAGRAPPAVATGRC